MFPFIVMIVPIASCAACAVLIVLLRPVLNRYALARPNARSSHIIPTAQGGGIAVIAATIAVAAIGLLQMNEWTSHLYAVLGATIILALVGAFDDIRPIPVLPRLALQTLAVGIALAVLPEDARLVPVLPFWLERALFLIGALWFVNLVNFMDGLDWITVAEVVPVTAALAVFGWCGQMSAAPTVLALALCGAALGFAPFNKPVAKLFLGDVGSLPIGLLLGWCLLQLAFGGHVIAALLLPLYYLADATITLFRRLSAGERIWVAHRSHFYQRATANGFTAMQVAGEVFILNLILAALAAGSMLLTSPYVAVTTLALGAGAVAFVLNRFSRPREALA